MTTRALSRGSLENTLDMTRFATHIAMRTAQLKARSGMVKAFADGAGGKYRRSSHAHHASQQENSCKP
jgi:hypothetical protein